MLQKFFKYIFQSMAGMLGISVYILADTYFISVYSGADGLAVLNLILPVYGLIYAIGAMIGIGSATRYAIDRSESSISVLFCLPRRFLCPTTRSRRLRAMTALRRSRCSALSPEVCSTSCLTTSSCFRQVWD